MHINISFQNTNYIMDHLLRFRGAIIEEFNAQVCSTCGLTTANIRDDEFSCRGGLINQIVYRAMVIGTSMYSAPGLVSLMESWVASGTASITVLSSRLHLDKDCSTPLDTLSDPDCPLEVEIPTIMPTTLPTTAVPMTTTLKEAKETSTKPEDKDDKLGPSVKPVVGENVRAGEIGGFLVGAIIAILLVVLIVVIIIIAVRKFKYSKKKLVNSINKKYTNIDSYADHYFSLVCQMIKYLMLHLLTLGGTFTACMAIVFTEITALFSLFLATKKVFSLEIWIPRKN